jgi:hypothetical protein
MNISFYSALALALLLPALARGQGTLRFVYTFAGDDSPMHLSATFQASQAAVATGLLTMMNGQPTDNILTDQPHYVLYQGIQCPIFWMNFPVDPKSGQPILVDGNASYTTVSAEAPDYTAVEIDDGVHGYPSEIVIWQHGDPVAQYPNSFGQWAVSYTIPEPNATTLLLFGLAAHVLRRQHRRHPTGPPTLPTQTP